MAPRLKGTDVTVKLALVAVPSSVVTVMGPVVAPAGTVVVTVPELFTVNVATLPPNETAVAPVKFVPVIVTPAPTPPKVGAKEVMAGVTVKRVVVTIGPLLGVVTVMGPVVAPLGTVVVIVPEINQVIYPDVEEKVGTFRPRIEYLQYLLGERRTNVNMHKPTMQAMWISLAVLVVLVLLIAVSLIAH